MSAQTAPLAPANPAHRLEYVDGLRALAAIWVALHHVVVTSVPERTLATPIVGAIVGSLFFGQFPVMFFLLLSGFCLYFPCVRKNPERPALSTAFVPYLRRRAGRIAPPYVFAGAFCLVMATVPALQVGGWAQTGPIDTGVIVSHLLFVHNLIPAYSSKIDYPMWSIGLEWQLYLFFPLLVWAFRRTNGVLVTALTLLVAMGVRATYRHMPGLMSPIMRDGPLAYLMIFAVGMIAASLTVKRTRIAPNWVLGAGAVVALMTVRFSSGNGLVHDLAATLAALAVLLLAAEPETRVSKLLSTPWLVWIGVFSYSIYLVHAPLLHLVWFALVPLKLSPDLYCAALMLALPPIVAACYGFHICFERPFMRLGPTSVRKQPAPIGGSSPV